MNKLVFIHDHPFYKLQEGLIMTSGSFPREIWTNYLSAFSRILVFGRRNLKFNDSLSISSRDNVNFYLTENYSDVKSLFLNYFKIKKELEEHIRDANVVLLRLPSVLGIVAAHIASNMNKKIWVEQVGNAKEAMEAHGSIIGKVSSKVFNYFNKKIVKKADFVSYVTQTKLQRDYPCKDDAIQLSASNVVIRNILDISSLEKSRFKGKIFRIGMIGGFDVKYKGQDILLKAINLLPIEVKENIELYFAGKGDFTWVLNIAQELGLYHNIQFIGSLKAGDEVNEFLRKLSLYVQPSLTEGMPRATIEAMSMGCAVIGSDVGGIPDIVNPKFIHAKGDFVKLSNDILHLYEDRNLLSEEAIMSLEKAKPYLKTRLDNKREKFYNEMMKRLR